MLASPASTISSSTPFIGGKSILEIVIVATAYGLLIAFAAKIDGVGDKGTIASILGSFAVLFALRNNILTFFFSISFERALFYHKAFAVLTMALVAAHATAALTEGAEEENEEEDIYDQLKTGFASLGFMVFMGLTYGIKKFGNFEIFYYLHIASYIAIIVLAALHGATPLVISVAFWGFDMLLRYLLTVHKVEAAIEMLPADVVRIRFPKRFAYSPGQYCFVSVPALSYLQFHVSN
jgi:hypothetical protein